MYNDHSSFFKRAAKSLPLGWRQIINKYPNKTTTKTQNPKPHVTNVEKCQVVITVAWKAGYRMDQVEAGRVVRRLDGLERDSGS